MRHPSKLKVAVVGLGHLGRHHARIYHEMPDVSLAAVCDIDKARGETLARKYRARYVRDFHDLQGLASLASVATPTSTHLEVASFLLQSGLHVLVEKPMAPTLKESRQLVRIASSAKRFLHVGHVERFNPVITAMRTLHIEPKFIECHRLSPFSFRSVDIGVVMDLMIHDLDIILELADSEVERLEAVGVPVIGNLEDIANARITFKSGCVANVTASRVSRESLRRIRVFSPDSYITLDYASREGWIYRKGPKLSLGSLKFEEIDPSKIGDLKEYLFKELLSVERIAIADEEPLYKELEAFVKSVSTGENCGFTGKEALRVMELAQAVLESIRACPWYPGRHGDSPAERSSS